MRQRLFNSKQVTDGLRIALFGFFKKIVIANQLGVFVNNVYADPGAFGGINIWIIILVQPLYLYFDFSGYTDIAIGMGVLLGFNLPENFNQPYRQPNLTLFWNNWHMSLTQWFRGYFFNPLTRKLRKARKFSVPVIILFTQLATFIIIGLWHGITANFIIWGAWHGLGIFIHNRWSSFANPKTAKLVKERPFLGPIFKFSGILGTFLFVSLGWVWFALPTTSLAFTTFAKLFGIG